MPHIEAASDREGWREVGFAVAEDRLWQMEMSRHLAEGRLSEILGPSGLDSDREVRMTAYSTAELEAQIEALPKSVKEAFQAYSDGVNEFIASGKLPSEYAQNGLKPEPWTPVDSAAVSVRLLQFFGKGGAGAIRNQLALTYLSSRKQLSGHLEDVLDDLLWQNDPASPTTVAKEDELPSHPVFSSTSRAVTVRHLAMLPQLSLFELLPGLRVAAREESTRVAEREKVPFKTGSYCMVVGSQRSGTGMPLLLSGPQMGFTTPSIVHELSISTPNLHVVGMDVPGIPGVLVGHTRHLAWGITSGVADTDDIVYAPLSGDGQYLSDGQAQKLEKRTTAIHVKGGEDVQVSQERTLDSVVVLSTKPQGSRPGYVFGKRSSYRNRELESLSSIFGLYSAADVVSADQAVQGSTMSFNAFFADDSGHIGYRYCGLMPLRTSELDPRFPVPDDRQYAWKGMLPVAQMPHVMNPKSGLLTNWNNKPVSWWPNLDTPVWGKIFRVSEIRTALDKPVLTSQNLELAAWKIARSDETWPYFKPFWMGALGEIRLRGSKEAWSSVQQAAGGFDGEMLDGSRQAAVYLKFIHELRNKLFIGSMGNFMGEANFEFAVQPSVMLAALEGHTKFDYLQGRKPLEVVRESLLAAVDTSVGSRLVPGQIRVPGQPSVPYGNRGTYIQVIELLADGPSGRNVLPPGVAASGPHSLDQLPLSRAWVYKPMVRPWK